MTQTRPTAEPRQPVTVGQPTPATGLANLTGRRDFQDLPHGCRCGARWAGSNTAHCAARSCHRTFSGPSTFDDHRRGGECLDPAEAGMSLLAGRAYECWGFPAEVTP